MQTLRNYVHEDLKLIEKIKPDLIVGDFRLSLSTSARLVGIPYITITNAYWSPYYARNGFPLPVLPMTKVLPLPVATVLFRLVQRLAFGLHCKPLNQVRQENGLHTLGNDLRRLYTDADYTLYADTPQMFPTENLPTNHRYLGPILWSPPIASPAWWERLPGDKPIIYLTLGSSGETRLLQVVLEALAALPITVMVATAGATLKQPLPANIYVADYLRGTEAAARATLVICNGGSLTSQQALAANVPVLGIASNMDQFLNIKAIVEAGAGVLLRADRISLEKVRTAVVEIILSNTYADGATKLANTLKRNIAPKQFAAFINEITGCHINKKRTDL
jgi:UDP:flavonoid glycosyltransferase YjiC (YdhE family)